MQPTACGWARGQPEGLSIRPSTGERRRRPVGEPAPAGLYTNPQGCALACRPDRPGAGLKFFLGDKAVTEIKLATAQPEHVQAYLRAFAR